MQRVAVEVGVDGDGGDAQLLARTDDPDSDLAAVGDEDLGEHAIWWHAMQGAVSPDRAARPAPGFADVRWVAETGSTNGDLLDGGSRAGRAEGVVLVADHQTAGRGRLGRTWEAPPGASLLVSVLLRPSSAPADADLVTAAAAVRRWPRRAARSPRSPPGLKWPNDLVVVAGDGSRPQARAGILAESVVERRPARRRRGRASGST